MMRSSLAFKLFTAGFGLVLSGCSAHMHRDPEVKTETTTEYPEVMKDTTPPYEMMMGDEDKPMIKPKRILPRIYEFEEVWKHHIPLGTDRDDPAFEFVTRDQLLPNVLIIGNSISIGYTPTVQQLLEEVANVYRIPDNARDTRYGLAYLGLWLGNVQWDIIHFNFGLHDLNQRWFDEKKNLEVNFWVPIDEYQSNLELIVQQLLATKAVLIWATTSVVPEGAIGRISGGEETYNTAAQNVLERYPNILIDDQFKLTSNHPTEQIPADVHFIPKGYARIGNQTAKIIKQALADM